MSARPKSEAMTGTDTAICLSAARPRLRYGPSLRTLVLAAALVPGSVQAQAQQQGEEADCSAVPDHQRLTEALPAVVAPGDPAVTAGSATTCGR
jgi:hypothetical protein